MDTPLVSVVMAAYNRSNVMKLAIDSLLRSTFGDWELLVVDDASTDDTAEVAATFDDPRVRYVQLDENVGEQSGPNNVGIGLARGKYVAFLNQDDLWFPEHLERLVEGIQSGEADGVFSLGFAASATHMGLGGNMPGGVYDPRVGIWVVASTWLLRKRLLEELGGWRSCREIRLPPSQDLLLRAWRAGRTLRLVPVATVVAIHSGSRVNSYAERHDEPNRTFAEQMQSNPHFREELLLKVLCPYVSRQLLDSLSLHTAFASHLWGLAKRLGLMLGIMPLELYFLLRYFRKGSFIDTLRKKRGLGRLPRART